MKTSDILTDTEREELALLIRQYEDACDAKNFQECERLRPQIDSIVEGGAIIYTHAMTGVKTVF